MNTAGIVTGTQSVRFIPVMVVDPARNSVPVHSSFVAEGKHTKDCCRQKCKQCKFRKKILRCTVFLLLLFSFSSSSSDNLFYSKKIEFDVNLYHTHAPARVRPFKFPWYEGTHHGALQLLKCTVHSCRGLEL